MIGLAEQLLPPGEAKLLDTSGRQMVCSRGPSGCALHQHAGLSKAADLPPRLAG